MIREIIKFTNDLLADYPEIEQIKKKPDPGLHVFIDLDQNGNWANRELVKGKDYDYFDGKNTDIAMWNECIRYQEASAYITMNKVKRFDKKQKIHSCSPFSIAYNYKFKDEEKKERGIKVFDKKTKPSQEEIVANNKLIRQKRYELVKTIVPEYVKNAISIYGITDKGMIDTINKFYSLLSQIVDYLDANIDDYSKLSDTAYLHVYLRTIDIAEQERLHEAYVEDNLLNGGLKDDKGILGFFTGYNSKKPFMYHKTGIMSDGINQLFSKNDALTISKFEKMWKRKCFPNPLPIIVDKREINKKIIKIFNEANESLSFHKIIEKLFSESNSKDQSCYYLLNYVNTMSGMQINDLDFVPQFRYNFENTLVVENIMQSGYVKDGVFEVDAKKSLKNVFDFEVKVVKHIFNNALVKTSDDSYSTNYFGEIKPEYVRGGHSMWQLIMKYRKAFYDFIYKSRQNAITTLMFDDMMYESILSNVRYDKVKTKFFSNNNDIKTKLNIWFSLYDYFDNNKNTINMTSRVKELKDKIRAVANGEADIASPEEFAYASGQLVSYLIDRSVASDKDYSMLEPYLQKAKSGQLQDAIAHTITIYKHDIKVCKGKFENLASNVLADGSNVEMKPLLKFFLAGCFSTCVIYEKKETNE